MNIQRHVRKMNALLEAELGPNPLYAWIHSESGDFKRAMRTVDEGGNYQWDYRCVCGRNVAIHRPDCLLTTPEPIWEWRKTLPYMEDQWVLCELRSPPSEHEWGKMFGTRLQYPARGTWQPVQTETHVICMPPGQAPGENITMAVIRGRQRSRVVPDTHYVSKRDAEVERAETEAKRKQIRERIADVLPVNPTPGTCGSTVFGGYEES